MSVEDVCYPMEKRLVRCSASGCESGLREERGTESISCWKNGGRGGEQIQGEKNSETLTGEVADTRGIKTFAVKWRSALKKLDGVEDPTPWTSAVDGNQGNEGGDADRTAKE